MEVEEKKGTDVDLEKQAEEIAHVAVYGTGIPQEEVPIDNDPHKGEKKKEPKSKPPSPIKKEKAKMKTKAKEKKKSKPDKKEPTKKVIKMSESRPVSEKIMLPIFKAWRGKMVYMDISGNYHIKDKGKEKGKIAPWNKMVKKAFPKAEDFVTAYKKASKKGLLADKKSAKEKPIGKVTSVTKTGKTVVAEVSLNKRGKALLNKRKVQNVHIMPLLKRRNTALVSVTEKEMQPRLLRRNSAREIPEAKYASTIPAADAAPQFAIGKSITVKTIRDLYETGLRAIQNHLINECPKIFIIDIIAPRHRVPKNRYLIEATSPERALTGVRNENEKRIRSKKRPLFDSEDILKLVVPLFKDSLMEV